MQLRRLGRTGLQVSEIGLGTVELGMDYGIKGPGSSGRPGRTGAALIVRKALEYGINLFDTAASYGESENILGEVLGPSGAFIATKVSIPPDGVDVRKYVEDSVKKSLMSLKRKRLDILQVHNATSDTINKTEMPDILADLKRKGLIGFTGVSVYGPQDAMAALRSGAFDVLQIAYNILDRRMADEVIPAAKKADIGIICRSAYLQGVLTQKVEYMDDRYRPLKDMAEDIRKMLRADDMEQVAKTALRFCLSTSGIDTVLVGTKTEKYLESAVQAAEEGCLDEVVLRVVSGFECSDERWLDPRNWPAR